MVTSLKKRGHFFMSVYGLTIGEPVAMARKKNEGTDDIMSTKTS
jgi:hypothetical protein